jgi:hypothetical protein
MLLSERGSLGLVVAPREFRPTPRRWSLVVGPDLGGIPDPHRGVLMAFRTPASVRSLTACLAGVRKPLTNPDPSAHIPDRGGSQPLRTLDGPGCG